MTTAPLKVSFAYSNKNNAEKCVEDIKQQFGNIDPTLIIFFCASSYNLSALGRALSGAFSCTISGCTTAGEVSFMACGYSKDSLVAVALESQSLKAKSYFAADLNHFRLPATGRPYSDIEADFPFINEGVNHFGLLLIDGMSFQEEQVIGSIHSRFNNLPIIGASAGDDFRFQNTYIYHEGKFYPQSCVLIIVETSHKFKIFQTQHFEPTKNRLVITEADPARRIVKEINGYPAAQEYARLIGIDRDKLNRDIFSLHPVMLKIGGEYYVRSIQRVNEDDSLSFYCAIDNGLVLTVGQGKRLYQTTKHSLQIAAKDFNNVAFTLGFDCILRKLEVEACQLQHELSQLFTEFQVVGFSTYGEQYQGFHVSQTLTGLMIGD